MSSKIKHDGIDIVPVDLADAKGCGAPVFSARSGVVSQICDIEDENFYCGNTAEERDLIGNYIKIDHGNGLETRYAHLETIDPQVKVIGQEVTEYTYLGKVGSTGMVFGDDAYCHLDFTVFQDDESRNPYWYFRPEGRYIEASGEIGSFGLIVDENIPHCAGYYDVSESNAEVTKYRHYRCLDFENGVENGWLEGPKPEKNYKFMTDTKINRAAFLKMIFEAQGITPSKPVNDCYNDVPRNAWFAPYVCYAQEQNIATGYPDGRFLPEREIRFDEASKMLLRAFKIPLIDMNYNEGTFWNVRFLDTIRENELIEPLIFLASDEYISRGFAVHYLTKFLEWKPIGSRRFKTSIENIIIKDKKVIEESQYNVLATIPNSHTEVFVLGLAEKGEYSEKYKTDRWYNVWFEGRKGYVEATLLHPEWIEHNLLPDSNINYWKDEVKKRDLIVLHFTGDNKTLEQEREYFSRTIKSSHFIVDRNGNIMQLVPDFYTAHHAQPENQRSIGIEIMNWGPIKQEEDIWYNWSGSETIDEEIDRYNVLERQPNIWNIWNLDNNPNEQQDNFGGKSQYWQSYSSSQYESLNKLLEYIEEKFDIPHQSFNYPVPEKENCDSLGVYSHRKM